MPPSSAARLRVEVVSRLRRTPLSSVRCRRLLERAAGSLARGRLGEGLPAPPELTVLFAGDATMRRLNRRFRGQDRSTDVLSFPAGPAPRGCGGDEGVRLGELAIGVGAARRQARIHGHALAREIEILLLHGFLHLLGYDHETDRGEMTRLEERLRRRLGIEAASGGRA